MAAARLSLQAVASAQPGAAQVFGPAGLVVAADGAFVRQTASEPGGLLVSDVRHSRCEVTAFDADVRVWVSTVEMHSREATVVTITPWPPLTESPRAC